MKGFFPALLICCLFCIPVKASDNTLRLDYVFTGGCSTVNAALSRMSVPRLHDILDGLPYEHIIMAHLQSSVGDL